MATKTPVNRDSYQPPLVQPSGPPPKVKRKPGRKPGAPRAASAAPFHHPLVVLVPDYDHAKSIRPLAILRHKERHHGSDRLTAYLPEGWNHTYRPPVHSSSVRDYQKCPRYFAFRDRLGLSIPGAYSEPLSIGTAFHKALEIAYRGGGPQARRDAIVKQATDFLAREVRPRVNDLGLMPDGTAYTSFADTVHRDALKALAMAEIYLMYYPADPEKYEVVDAEKAVVAKFYGRLDMIQGKIDLVLKNRKTGALWLLDFKTTQKLPWDVAQALTIDVQPQHYRMLAQAYYPKLKVAGFMHDVIQKPAIRFCPDTVDKLHGQDTMPEAIAKKLADGKPLTDLQQQAYTDWQAKVESDKQFASPFEKYLGRMVDWYKGRFEEAEASGPDPFSGRVSHPMLRSIVPFATPGIEGDKRAVILDACKAARVRLTLDNFPRCGNMYTCLDRGGCEYLPLCSNESNMVIWPELISKLYVQRHRDEEEEV